MRFDPQRSVYRDCKWCKGLGCIYCASEADKDYKTAFPDGPVPIASFTIDEFPSAKEAIGIDALQKAFSKGGGGIEEIIENVAKLKKETK